MAGLSWKPWKGWAIEMARGMYEDALRRAGVDDPSIVQLHQRYGGASVLADETTLPLIAASPEFKVMSGLRSSGERTEVEVYLPSLMVAFKEGGIPPFASKDGEKTSKGSGLSQAEREARKAQKAERDRLAREFDMSFPDAGLPPAVEDDDEDDSDYDESEDDESED